MNYKRLFLTHKMDSGELFDTIRSVIYDPNKLSEQRAHSLLKDIFKQNGRLISTLNVRYILYLLIN